MLRKPDEITHKGVKLSDALEAHRRWLYGMSDGERLDWDGASLNGAYLDRASLDGAYLNGAYLNRASLDGASLDGASLDGAYLDGAYLNRASLDGASLDGASLDRAYLNRAYLDGASLDGAYLDGATGNMRQIKSAHFDKWAIAWIKSPDGVTTLQIGCQRHDLELWRKSDPRWIGAMDIGAADWWKTYRDVILALVDASPAVPYKKGGDT